jgi:hypothetical protein
MLKNRKTLFGCISAVIGGSCLCVVLFGFILLSSCHVNKPLVASGLPDPDKAFYTGMPHGYQVYIWECYRNKRIAIYTFIGMYAGAYEREEVACGELTKIEKTWANKKQGELDPKQFWGTSSKPK